MSIVDNLRTIARANPSEYSKVLLNINNECESAAQLIEFLEAHVIELHSRTFSQEKPMQEIATPTHRHVASDGMTYGYTSAPTELSATYYVRHPDDTYSVAYPQPILNPLPASRPSENPCYGSEEPDPRYLERKELQELRRAVGTANEEISYLYDILGEILEITGSDNFEPTSVLATIHNLIPRGYRNNPTGKPYCCHYGCNLDAVWDVYGDPMISPEDNTNACDAHLAYLLEDRPFRVVPIKTGE
jgi:hypothetical protein